MLVLWFQSLPLACIGGSGQNSDTDCLTDKEEKAAGTDPLSADSDGDGLDDCAEVRDFGSDPLAIDGDGDGISDPDEVACVSDPADPEEVCYACGWQHDDPGTLGPTGSNVGDVVGDVVLWDQCVEPVKLHDWAGRYVLLFETTMWCTACVEEVLGLADETAAISAETDLPITPLVALFQDVYGDPPPTNGGQAYADGYALSGFPVTSDPDQAILSALPPDGSELPAQCLLNPQMQIVDCHIGRDAADDITAWMQADAAR